MGDLQQAATAEPARITPQMAIRDALDKYRPVFTKLLAGTGVTEETFGAQIANACRATPALFECNPTTVLGAALRCAQLGLAPNDGRNLAWIIPYKGQAQMQLGYGGIMELARRAVPGLRFDGRAVYPNDDFDIEYGRDQQLVHRPAVVKQMDRGGEAYAWYVRAIYPNGNTQTHVLDHDGVEYHRSFSKMKNGDLWKTSYDAAALKSVVLDMKRFLPASAQLAAGLASDEQVIKVDDVRPVDDDVLDLDSTEDTDPEPDTEQEGPES